MKGKLIPTVVVLLIAAIIIVAVVMTFGLTTFAGKKGMLGKVGDAILNSMGIYHITIHNEEEFRGLLECVAAAHYHFKFTSREKMKEMEFKDLEGTEMEGCTIRGRVPRKINVDFEIKNKKGFIVLGSGNLGNSEVGTIRLPEELTMKKGLFGKQKQVIMPIAEDNGCDPIYTEWWSEAEKGMATLIKNGEVWKTSSKVLKCARKKETEEKLPETKLAAIKVYDKAKATINIRHNRELEPHWKIDLKIFVIPITPNLQLNDILVLKMDIKDKGIGDY